MTIESIFYVFDILWFRLLSYVLIGHYNCLQVERCNYLDYIMNRLSITSHCYTCENWIVKHMITSTITCLRPGLTSSDLVRRNTYLILHAWTILYALYVSRIIGRKEILLHQGDILVYMITSHVLLLCFVQVLSMIHMLIHLMCSAFNKHIFNINWENISKILNPTKTVLVISDNHWNLILLSLANYKNNHLSWDDLVLPQTFTINGGYTLPMCFMN